MMRATPIERCAPATRGRGGFTLVEVAVSMLLLAIGALLFAGAISTSLSANAFAREHDVALEAAQSQLEPLISQPLQPVFSLPTLLLFNGTTFPVDGLSGANGARAGSIAIDVTGLPLVTITVTVQWVGLLGPASVTLKTTVLVASTGL